MPMKVIVHENSGDHTLILRNSSIYDIAVKIVSSNPSVQLERKNAMILSKKYTTIKIKTSSAKLINEYQSIAVHIYGRAVYPFNRKNIVQWIEGKVADKIQNKITSLSFSFDDNQYAAEKIIIDVPGRATVVESTGYALKMKTSPEVLRAFLEHDAHVAVEIDQKSIDSIKSKKTIKPAVEHSSIKKEPIPAKTKSNDSCFLLPIFQSMCNPTTKIEAL